MFQFYCNWIKCCKLRSTWHRLHATCAYIKKFHINFARANVTFMANFQGCNFNHKKNYPTTFMNNFQEPCWYKNGVIMLKKKHFYLSFLIKDNETWLLSWSSLLLVDVQKRAWQLWDSSSLNIQWFRWFL